MVDFLSENIFELIYSKTRADVCFKKLTCLVVLQMMARGNFMRAN